MNKSWTIVFAAFIGALMIAFVAVFIDRMYIQPKQSQNKNENIDSIRVGHLETAKEYKRKADSIQHVIYMDSVGRVFADNLKTELIRYDSIRRKGVEERVDKLIDSLRRVKAAKLQAAKDK